MKKFLLLGFLSMFGTSQAHAGFINTVTGADMAGLQVTATFAGGATETLIWHMTSPGSGLTDTISLESEIGGVFGSMFTLSQQGDSQGNVDTNGTPNDFSDDTIYGLWTLTSLIDETLTSLFIEVLNTNVVFDTLFADNGNGSDRGRAFTTTASGTSYSYGDLVQDELFGSLLVNVDLAKNQSLTFLADTDLVTVPAPATLSLLLLAMGGLVVRRKQA